MNIDAVAIAVGLGAAALALGLTVALVMRGRMGRVPCCWKCGTPLSQREVEFLKGDDGRWWCNRCIANATAGGPT